METKADVYPEFSQFTQNDYNNSCCTVYCSKPAAASMMIGISVPGINTVFGRVNLCASCAQKAMAAMFPIPEDPKPEEQKTEEICQDSTNISQPAASSSSTEF